MQKTFSWRPWMTFGLLCLFVAAVALGVPRVGSADQHGDVPPELEAAMDAYIAEQGEESVGACEAADVEEDIGMWCWQVVSMTEDRATVQMGLTFAEPAVQGVFERTNGEWQFVEEDDVDAPHTGTAGLVADGGDRAWTGAAMAAGLVLVVAGGAGIAISARRPS